MAVPFATDRVITVLEPIWEEVVAETKAAVTRSPEVLWPSFIEFWLSVSSIWVSLSVMVRVAGTTIRSPVAEPVTAMVSDNSAALSSVTEKPVSATGAVVSVPSAGISKVGAVPGAVKSAASAVAVPSASNDRVMLVSTLITELVVVEGKEAVAVSPCPVPDPSPTVDELKARVIAESSSTMVSVSGVTVASVSPAVTVPVTRNVSGPSAIVSLLRVKPVSATAVPVIELAGMVTSTVDAEAVKSVPPSSADSGSSSSAFTDTVVAEPNSDEVAVVKRARTRTAGVSSSGNSS